MQLKQFISDTLQDIVAGVRGANDKIGIKQFVIYNIKENVVEFDVAVTVSDGKTEVAEGSLGGGVLGIGAKVLGRLSNSKFYFR